MSGGLVLLPLRPKYEYSARIYGELLPCIAGRTIELVGSSASTAMLSRLVKPVVKPVGDEHAKRLKALFGIRGGNAASAVALAYAVTQTLCTDSRIVRLDPHLSELRVDRCIFGEAVSRYRPSLGSKKDSPLKCTACMEYNRRLAASVGARFVPPKEKISTGSSCCVCHYECPHPPDLHVPGRLRTELLTGLLKLSPRRNHIIISSFSSSLLGIGDVIPRVLGAAASLIPARSTFRAGAYQGPLFSRKLGLSGGLKDAASLVSNVRETLDCKVRVDFSDGGFAVTTKKCPHVSGCSAGNFIEVACVSYTRGLLSQWGDFEIRSEVKDGVCRQEFRQASNVGAGLKKTS